MALEPSYLVRNNRSTPLPLTRWYLSTPNNIALNDQQFSAVPSNTASAITALRFAWNALDSGVGNENFDWERVPLGTVVRVREANVNNYVDFTLNSISYPAEGDGFLCGVTYLGGTLATISTTSLYTICVSLNRPLTKAEGDDNNARINEALKQLGSQAPVLALDNLTDVVSSGASFGQVLQFDSENWVPIDPTKPESLTISVSAGTWIDATNSDVPDPTEYIMQGPPGASLFSEVTDILLNQQDPNNTYNGFAYQKGNFIKIYRGSIPIFFKVVGAPTYPSFPTVKIPVRCVSNVAIGSSVSRATKSSDRITFLNESFEELAYPVKSITQSGGVLNLTDSAYVSFLCEMTADITSLTLPSAREFVGKFIYVTYRGTGNFTPSNVTIKGTIEPAGYEGLSRSVTLYSVPGGSPTWVCYQTTPGASGGGASAGSATPLMNGIATAGTAPAVSHEDHVHPSDTSRASVASPEFTGTAGFGVTPNPLFTAKFKRVMGTDASWVGGLQIETPIDKLVPADGARLYGCDIRQVTNFPQNTSNAGRFTALNIYSRIESTGGYNVANKGSWYGIECQVGNLGSDSTYKYTNELVGADISASVSSGRISASLTGFQTTAGNSGDVTTMTAVKALLQTGPGATGTAYGVRITYAITNLPTNFWSIHSSHASATMYHGGKVALGGAERVPTSQLDISGDVTHTTPAADDNSTKSATTAWYFGQKANAVPLANGTAAIGTSTQWAAEDHVHPSDTSREPAITGDLVSKFWSGTKTWRDLATDVRAAVLTGLGAGVNTAILATDSLLVALANLQAQVSAKQATLVSGTNIKTINNTSLLGGGDIQLSVPVVSATAPVAPAVGDVWLGTSMSGSYDTGWQNLSLLNSWVAGAVVPQYRRVGNLVTLRGFAQNSFANNNTIGFTMPVGCRSTVSGYYKTNGGVLFAGQALVNMSSSGDTNLVDQISASGTIYVALSGVSFYID